MTLERHIAFARAEIPPPEETAAEARARLGDLFPKAALRRMTHLGLLTGAALQGVTPGPEDAVVYASTFAEARALEDYLASFPSASPLLFQTSIHPSAVQQVLIGRQQPLRRFWPLTGRTRLVESALLTALLEPAARCLLVGGEERGTWLAERGLASASAFAFCMALSPTATDSIGRIAHAPALQTVPGKPPTLPDLARAIQSRTPLAWSDTGGQWTLSWKS